MSELKLLNCPFCDGEAYTDKIGKPLFTIRCTNINCYCEISKNSLEDAINAWNTRATMANIVEKLEELKKPPFIDTPYHTGFICGVNYSINIVKQESEQIDKKF